MVHQSCFQYLQFLTWKDHLFSNFACRRESHVDIQSYREYSVRDWFRIHLWRLAWQAPPPQMTSCSWRKFRTAYSCLRSTCGWSQFPSHWNHWCSRSCLKLVSLMLVASMGAHPQMSQPLTWIQFLNKSWSFHTYLNLCTWIQTPLKLGYVSNQVSTWSFRWLVSL